MAEEKPVNPDKSSIPNNDKLKEAEEIYKRIEAEIKSSASTYNELMKSSEKFKDLQKEIVEYFKAGKIDVGVYDNLKKDLEKSKEVYKEIAKETQSTFSKVIDDTGSLAKKGIDGILEKFDLSMETLNLPGIILAIFQNLDAARVIGGFAGETAKIFGKIGDSAGKNFANEFGKSMTHAGESTSMTFRFVTDQLRDQLAQDFFKLGLQIRGVTGSQFAALSNDLIVVSQAFKIPLDNIAKYTFAFQDIFRVNTERAMKSIKDVITNAYTLGVAPERFLNLIANQTEQFKLQRIQISEVSDTYRRFYQGLGLGVEVSEELTQKVVSSLAQLSSGKLAAYISLTTGFTGEDLTDTMLDFYRGQASGQNTTNSRLELVQNTLKVLQEKFPEITKNQYVGVKAVMEIFGIQQMEVGVRLYDALSKQIKGISSNNDLMSTVNDILTDTHSAVEQGLGLILNALSWLIRLALGAYNFFVGEISESFLTPLETQIQKQSALLGANFEPLKIDKQMTSKGLSKLDVIMIQQAETNKHLTNLTEVTKASAIATTSSLTGLPMGGGAQAVAAQASLIKQFVTLKVDVDPRLKGFLDFTQQNSATA